MFVALFSISRLQRAVSTVCACCNSAFCAVRNCVASGIVLLDYIQYWRWESFPCLTVSHKFPRDTLCPVVIQSISEHFCDYHGTWLSPRYNHRNFQTWVITTELSGHDVSCGNLWDTVRHGKLSHRQYCI